MFASLILLVSVAFDGSPFVNANSMLSRSFARDLMPRATSTCSTGGPLSCSNSSATGSCCLEAPGGLLLQTQFWDTNPSTGPTDSWTIHGLWPDNCDGSFNQSCDLSRAYTGLGDTLSAQGASSTLAFMQEFWKDISGNDESFWEHEWSKHGTCMSTLVPSCLPGSQPRAEAVAFFQTVVRLFQTLPTYNFLTAKQIVPSTTATYALSDIISALREGSGFAPTVSCDGSNLNEVWYYFHLSGSVIDGEFTQIEAPSFTTNGCPSTGIKWLPKTASSPTSTSTSTTATATSTSGPAPTSVPAKFTLNALRPGGTFTGGMLSFGTWSVQTLATYHPTISANGLTLTTSKGPCLVSGTQLNCAAGNSASVFSTVTSQQRMLLVFNGSADFSSDAVPSGIAQEPVFVGSDHPQQYQLVITAN